MLEVEISGPQVYGVRPQLQETTEITFPCRFLGPEQAVSTEMCHFGPYLQRRAASSQLCWSFCHGAGQKRQR